LNPPYKVLLVGGRDNGNRIEVDSLDPIKMIHQSKTSFNSTLAYGLKVSSPCETFVYIIHHIGYDNLIGVYEKITLREAMSLLLKRYPKKSKKKSPKSKKSNWKMLGSINPAFYTPGIIYSPWIPITVPQSSAFPITISP
jgi:hypothetical protein